MANQPKRACVIGSGFGGLSVAIRLAAKGMDVTLLEARDAPGGRAYVYRENGYTFDAGPTVITAPQCIEEVFACAGKNMHDYVEMLPVSPFYRLVWSDGVRFDYVGDEAIMCEQIAKLRPQDVEGYKAFVAYSKRVFDIGYTQLAAQPFLHARDMLKAAPHLVNLRADRSVYETVARFVEDEHVRQALSFHSLLVGGNPFSTSAIYTLIHYLERQWGVFFPRGGTGALVSAMVKLLTELGGTLHVQSPVTKILPGGSKNAPKHRVSWQHGESLREETFDLVVSNADIHHTYAKLLKQTPAALPMKRKLEAMEWSMSLFVLYFGTDISYHDHATHHTVLFGPRYQGLLNDIFKGPALPEDFSLYMHAPTITDPSLAPPGGGTFYVLSPVPHLGNAPIDWQVVGEQYADRIIAALSQELPDLAKHIVVKRWFTPHDFKTELSAFQGSAFSCAPILRQSAWFRPHNKDANIPGLYFVGAGTHPGAGLPGVINSAKATAGVICEDFAV